MKKNLIVQGAAALAVLLGGANIASANYYQVTPTNGNTCPTSMMIPVMAAATVANSSVLGLTPAQKAVLLNPANLYLYEPGPRPAMGQSNSAAMEVCLQPGYVSNVPSGINTAVLYDGTGLQKLSGGYSIEYYQASTTPYSQALLSTQSQGFATGVPLGTVTSVSQLTQAQIVTYNMQFQKYVNSYTGGQHLIVTDAAVASADARGVLLTGADEVAASSTNTTSTSNGGTTTTTPPPAGFPGGGTGASTGVSSNPTSAPLTTNYTVSVDYGHFTAEASRYGYQSVYTTTGTKTVTIAVVQLVSAQNLTAQQVISQLAAMGYRPATLSEIYGLKTTQPSIANASLVALGTNLGGTTGYPTGSGSGASGLGHFTGPFSTSLYKFAAVKQ